MGWDKSLRINALRLAMMGAVAILPGCTFVSDEIWPSLAGDGEETAAAAEGAAEREAQAARTAAVDTRQPIETRPLGSQPALGSSSFVAPGVTDFQPTGTIVGRKVQQLSGELQELQDRITQHNRTLQQIRGSTVDNAQRYHGTVAAIQARLQLGSTPGNPVLINQWNQAQGELDRVSQDIAAMNALANEVAADSSLAAFLLESARATYGIAGAIDEDHRQLAILEDETNKSVVVIDRLLDEISGDVSRQTAYVANERRSIGSLALAIKNGELYGSSLASRPFLPATTLSSTNSSDRSGLGPSAVTGQPLVVIRFDRENVQYEQALYTAVSRALEQRPRAQFDLVAVSPNQGSAADIALQRSRSRKHADEVLRTLTGMGLPADRLALTSTTSAEAQTSEVHVYVR